MGFWKRLWALALTAALFLSLLSGCAKDSEGLSLSVCVGPSPMTLDPIYAEDLTSQTVLTHM